MYQPRSSPPSRDLGSPGRPGEWEILRSTRRCSGEGRPPGTREEVLQHATVFGVQLLSTAIGAVFPDRVNYWAFLLMFLTSPVENQIKARWAKARAA